MSNVSKYQNECPALIAVALSSGETKFNDSNHRSKYFFQLQPTNIGHK